MPKLDDDEQTATLARISENLTDLWKSNPLYEQGDALVQAYFQPEGRYSLNTNVLFEAVHTTSTIYHAVALLHNGEIVWTGTPNAGYKA